jgi:hypothetical protein
MESMAGLQRFTANGTITPTNTPLRVYSLDLTSSVSSTSLSLWDGLSSATTYNLMLRLSSSAYNTQGTAHKEWSEGVAFSSGVYLNTSSGNCVVLVGYRLMNI